MIFAYETEAVGAAQRELDRAQIEMRLLACIAPIGRWGLALAARAGVALESFEQPDTTAIFGALLVAERDGCIVSRERTVCLVRRALVLAKLWDEADARSYVGGMRWGPGPLVTLFCRVSHQNAERLVPIHAAKLLALPAVEMECAS